MTRAACVLFVIMSFSFSNLIGCASPPIRSDFAKDMPQLRKGSYIEKVWFDNGTLSSSNYSEVRLETVCGVGVSDQDNITVAEAVQWIKDSIVESGEDSVVLRSTGEGASANLELVITELDPGSTAARFWAGEFGAGHAWVQVEGKLTDTTNHKLLGYFVERERKSGVATFRNARGYDSGPGLLHDMIEDICKKVRKEMRLALKM
jgi:hypothetical protein